MGRHSEVSLLPLPGLRGNRFDREALSITVKTRLEGRKVDVFQVILAWEHSFCLLHVSSCCIHFVCMFL